MLGKIGTWRDLKHLEVICKQIKQFSEHSLYCYCEGNIYLFYEAGTCIKENLFFIQQFLKTKWNLITMSKHESFDYRTKLLAFRLQSKQSSVLYFITVFSTSCYCSMLMQVDILVQFSWWNVVSGLIRKTCLSVMKLVTRKAVTTLKMTPTGSGAFARDPIIIGRSCG